jgi:hypothetical protein
MDGQLLSETFVELTDTMAAGFDVIDFLHVLTDRGVLLLDVSAAGPLLADPRGQLRVVAASSETVRLLELFRQQNDQGPCLDRFRVGRPDATEGLAAEARRWPRFAAAAQQAGFAAVQAPPMRLPDQVIGALNLFRAVPGAFDPADIRIGQALADVATISLLHERSMRHGDTLNEQLQTALNSRVIIEQAKGKLAGRLGLDMNQPFDVLRNHARARNQRPSDLAQALAVTCRQAGIGLFVLACFAGHAGEAQRVREAAGVPLKAARLAVPPAGIGQRLTSDVTSGRPRGPG